MQMDRLEGAVAELQRKIDLRDRYLRGELSAEQVELQGLLRAAEQRLATAQAVAGRVRRMVSELEKAHRAGLVDEAELRQARMQLQDAEAEEWLAQLEIQSLRQNLPN
jgi:outer membrane protein TolC